jgi:dienelactone hydrolase
MARYAVRSEPVRFRAGGEQIYACLYRPQLPNPQPGLLLIQEGWELGNQAKGMAERLAHVGYVTLAVDAHSGEHEDFHLAHRRADGVRPSEGEMESPLTGKQSFARAETNLRAAVAWLRTQSFVKDGIAGSIGFGPGGELSLLLATTVDHVQAAISIDGDMDVRADLAAGVRAPLLVIEAGAAAEQARELHEALGASDLPHEFVRYPLAARRFFDERLPAFRPDDAEDAWSRANKFCYKHLGEPG